MSTSSQAFVIRYADRAGAIHKRTVVGMSAADAERQSGIPKNQIISTRHDWLSQTLARMNEDKPSLELQAEIMASFAPQANSGVNVTSLFDDLVAQYPIFKAKAEEARRVKRIPEKMALLGFNSELQLLAEIGEQTNLIGEVLGGAADEMIKKQKVLADFKKAVIPPILSAVLGVLMMLVMPIFVAPEIKSVMTSRGIKMDSNFVTDFLMFLGDFMPKYWWTIVLFFTGLAMTAPRWFPYVKTFPVFITINEYFQLSRSFKFITGFQPLFSRGVPVKESLRLMSRHATRGLKESYESMLKQIENGGSMGASFNSDSWHRILRQMMTSSDNVLDQQKMTLMKSAKSIIENQMERVSGKIAGSLQMVGTTLTITVIIMIFYGMTLPLLTVHAN